MVDFLMTLKIQLTENTIIVSVMFANNEVGTVQPIKEISKICKKHQCIISYRCCASGG